MIITLTTDFGADSGYPAQMKGVLLQRAPAAHLVDVSHAVPHYDVTAGAFLLEAVVGAFPEGTVHLAVVDPGVGSARRALALRWQGHCFVGPDNGLFEPFLEGAEVRQITREGIFRKPVADTFHGRDIFAPAAAWLANGWALELLGPAVSDPVRLAWPATERSEGRLEAPLLVADSFGNLQSRIRRGEVPEDAEALVLAGSEWLPLGPVRRTYAEVGPGTLLALWGSSGRLEVAVAQGSAATRLGFERTRPNRVALRWS